jgi:DNA-binding response OmpR family regulator
MDRHIVVLFPSPEEDGMAKKIDHPKLLLVEDENSLQVMLEDALSDEGFKIVSANDGKSALKELEAKGAEFKALITDIRLGKGPDGWAVGHRARELVPGIPVIYISGDSAHEWTANGVPESVILQKPFVIAQLVTAVTTLLNAASSATALSDATTSDTETPTS